MDGLAACRLTKLRKLYIRLLIQAKAALAWETLIGG